MRIHLTCTNPRRRLVIALHAARTVLLDAGHHVSVSWPETWEDRDGRPQVGFNRAALADADVIVHASMEDDPLPLELALAAEAGRPVVHYAPGVTPSPSHGTGGLRRVASVRDVVEAVADAAAASVCC